MHKKAQEEYAPVALALLDKEFPKVLIDSWVRVRSTILVILVIIVFFVGIIFTQKLKGTVVPQLGIGHKISTIWSI